MVSHFNLTQVYLLSLHLVRDDNAPPLLARIVSSPLPYTTAGEDCILALILETCAAKNCITSPKPNVKGFLLGCFCSMFIISEIKHCERTPYTITDTYRCVVCAIYCALTPRYVSEGGSPLPAG